MYKEYLVTYMRSNIQDEKLIELGRRFNFTIDEDFIEDKIFHGCQGKFSKENLGTGDLYIFKSSSDEMLLVNTYLNPKDQLELMQLGVRCKSDISESLKEEMLKCFEEEKRHPIKEKLREYENNLIKSISSAEFIDESIFYGKKSINESIRVVVHETA